jgi:hypothetical protein
VQRGLSFGQQVMQQQKAAQQAQQENKRLQQLTGVDFSGITDPKQRQEIVASMLQGQNQRQLESLKGSNKAAESDAQLQRNLAIIADLENRYQLPQGSLAPYASNPAMAQKIAAPKADKNPIGGLGGIPLTPEESSQIAKVVNDNPDANAEQLEIAFNKSGVKPGSVKDILESRRRGEETKRKETAEGKKQARKEQLDFHKESAKYDEQLEDKARIAKNQIDTIKTIGKAIDSGKVRPSSLANVFKSFGEVGKTFSNAFLSDDEATLLASIPGLLEGWKEVFGVRLSDADLNLLKDKLPDIGKSPEANKAILNIMKSYADKTLLRNKIATDVKEKNNGLRPLGYADQIEKRYDDMVAPVKIINPNTGNVIEIPAYKVSDAINAGAQLANE